MSFLIKISNKKSLKEDKNHIFMILFLHKIKALMIKNIISINHMSMKRLFWLDISNCTCIFEHMFSPFSVLKNPHIPPLLVNLSSLFRILFLYHIEFDCKDFAETTMVRWVNTLFCFSFSTDLIYLIYYFIHWKMIF